MNAYSSSTNASNNTTTTTTTVTTTPSTLALFSCPSLIWQQPETEIEHHFCFTAAAKEILEDLSRDLDAIVIEPHRASSFVAHLDFSTFEHLLEALERQNQQLEMALAETIDERNTLICSSIQMNVILVSF